MGHGRTPLPWVWGSVWWGRGREAETGERRAWASACRELRRESRGGDAARVSTAAAVNLQHPTAS